MIQERDPMQAMFEREKWIKLACCIGLDVLGFASYLIPGIGESTDIAFAPITAAILPMLFARYGTRRSIAAGLIQLIEEALPFTDIIPTATLTWLLVFVKDKRTTFETFVRSNMQGQDP